MRGCTVCIVWGVRREGGREGDVRMRKGSGRDEGVAKRMRAVCHTVTTVHKITYTLFLCVSVCLSRTLIYKRIFTQRHINTYTRMHTTLAYSFTDTKHIISHTLKLTTHIYKTHHNYRRTD